MKRSMRKLLALMLLTVITVTGCGKGDSSNFTIGAWNDNVFENSWLNMKFEINDEWTIASDEQIAEVSGVGMEMLSELKGTSKESLEAMANLTTVYGFLVLQGEGDPSIQLMFENLAKTIEGKDTTEEKYLDIVFEQLSGMGYEILEEATDVKLADKTFKVLKVSAYEGLLLQNLYCCKQGNYMVVLASTYTEASESAEEEFMNNISTLK